MKDAIIFREEPIALHLYPLFTQLCSPCEDWHDGREQRGCLWNVGTSYRACRQLHRISLSTQRSNYGLFTMALDSCMTQNLTLPFKGMSPITMGGGPSPTCRWPRPGSLLDPSSLIVIVRLRSLHDWIARKFVNRGRSLFRISPLCIAPSFNSESVLATSCALFLPGCS